MRFDYYYHTIVTVITLGMIVILLFNIHVTADEAHVIYSINDAYLKGLQSSLSAVNTSTVANFGFHSMFRD